MLDEEEVELRDWLAGKFDELGMYMKDAKKKRVNTIKLHRAIKEDIEFAGKWEKYLGLFECYKEAYYNIKHKTKRSDHICPICGTRKLHFRSSKHEYSSICSDKKCINKFKIEKIKATNLEKYGVKNPNQLKGVREKIRQTMLERYGAEHHLQNPEMFKKVHKFNSYYYNDMFFDSSWELAFYIYCKSNNMEIEREAKTLEYYVDGKKHIYYPDFLIVATQELVEIKNPHLIETMPREKIDCLKTNKVILIGKEKIKFYLSWCKENNIDLETYYKKNLTKNVESI